MKILRCSVTVVAISLLAVLGTAQTSQAGPITYTFSGVLGDCETPLVGGCLNDWSGHTVVGQFTTDSALSTLLAASFTLINQQGGEFEWRIRFPDPVPNSTTFTVTPTSLQVHEIILPLITDDFFISLNFNSPLTPSAGSTLQSGFIARGIVPIHAPFVSGAAEVVPEPSSVVLVTTGLIGLFRVFGAARQLSSD
jgi:hypothetical protein